MNEVAAWEVAKAVLASLGGAAIVVGLLAKWIGELTAKRILAREEAQVLRSIEGLRQEFGLARASFDRHAQHVIDYYSAFYAAYQKCQYTASADILRYPDRPEIDTKRNYLETIDAMAADWNSRQGVLRLVLPAAALLIHSKIIEELNSFKDLVRTFDRSGESHEALRNSFARLHALKGDLESVLRKHLRTDNV